MYLDELFLAEVDAENEDLGTSIRPRLMNMTEQGGTHHLDAVCPRFTGAKESLNGFGAAWTAYGSDMRLALVNRFIQRWAATPNPGVPTRKPCKPATPPPGANHILTLQPRAYTHCIFNSLPCHQGHHLAGQLRVRDRVKKSRKVPPNRNLQNTRFSWGKKENRYQPHLGLYLLGSHVVQRSAPVLGDSHV